MFLTGLRNAVDRTGYSDDDNNRRVLGKRNSSSNKKFK